MRKVNSKYPSVVEAVLPIFGSIICDYASARSPVLSVEGANVFTVDQQNDTYTARSASAVLFFTILSVLVLAVMMAKPHRKDREGNMTELDAVLFANEAFYRAFADSDMTAMAGAWSEGAVVTCIHPGWGVLEGRDEVLESWRAILDNPDSPAIDCLAPRVHMQGEMAYVLCYEAIEGNYLLATNIFVHEGRRWRLVHHQAGPTAEDPPVDTEDEGAVIN
jgi:ketosteroid isomerase-like protein